jgi:hypothetical protein
MKFLGGEGSDLAEKRDNESQGNRGNAVKPKRHRTRLVSIVAFLLALETAGFLSLALLQWLRGDLFEKVSIPGIESLMQRIGGEVPEKANPNSAGMKKTCWTIYVTRDPLPPLEGRAKKGTEFKESCPSVKQEKNPLCG